MFSDFFEIKLKTSDQQSITYFKNQNFNKEERKTIVFNYGLVCSHSHFTEQIKYFKDDYNIIAHDYRGHFKSSSRDDLEDVNFQSFCSDLNLILETEELEEVILIGHSMGVNVSLEYSKKFPQKIEKQILISGTAQPVYGIMFNSNIVEHISPYLKKIFKNFPGAVSSFWGHTRHNPLIKKIIHRGGFNTKYVSTEFIDIYLSKINELGPDLFLKLLQQMNDHDIISYLSSIKTPSLIIGGDQDKVIPNYNQRILHEKLSNSELFIVKNGSHVPQVDFPDYINRRIKLFLQAPKEA